MKSTKTALRVYITALSLAVALSAPALLRAVPANPRPMEMLQADGTTVQIALRGDEYFHWNEDRGGYTVLKDTATRNWVYAEKDASGALRAGRNKVGAADPDKLGFARRLLDTSRLSAAKTKRAKVETSSPFRVSSSASTVSGVRSSSVPARTPILTGTMKNLVILARFSDQAPTKTQAEFDNLFNQVGYTTDGAVGSVKDYYMQVSYNKLTVQSVISPWVTLPNPMAYYGTNDASGNDAHPQQMVLDAINALHTQYPAFNFADADGNGDGIIDGLDIIHSGRGEEWDGNNDDYIWSHQWELDTPIQINGVTMSAYHTEAELRGWDDIPSSWGITRIGVICHETGHFLGLPDLYDTAGSSSGLGNFCIMSGGSWNGNYGTSPAHMSAWCKKTLGWATPTQLTTIGTKSLPLIEGNSSAMFLFRDKDFPSTEYFLMENRQGSGFDSGLPGSKRGILIWHVDENMPDNTKPGNTPANHYLVALEQAGGSQTLQTGGDRVTGSDSDYFRADNNAGFTAVTNPNSDTYSSLPLKLPISAISPYYYNPMTFTLGTTDATPPTAIASVYDGLGTDISKTGSLTQLSANWTASTDPETGPVTYRYAIGTSAGLANVADWTDNGASQSVTRSGLTLAEGTIYYFGVKAFNSVGVETLAARWSDGQQVDLTMPADVKYVNDGVGADIDYVSSQQVLSANWGAPDSGGILEYQYAIGTTPGGVDKLGWTTAGLATAVTKTGLTLVEDTTYYFAVKARNGNGFSSPVSSDGQRVDTTSPTARVEIISPLPAKTGPFTAQLILTEAGGLNGSPVLKLAQGGCAAAGVQMDMSNTVLSTWAASGYIESYLSTGTACLTFTATDRAGNTGTALAGNSFNVDPVVSGVTGGTVRNSDGASVTVPAGAYTSGLYITISTIPASRESTADAASFDSIRIRSVDLAREFKARTAAGAPITDFSAHPLTIALGYPDANNDGRIDGDFINENLAWLYYMDEVSGKWTPLAGVVRHPLGNTLSAEVSHFSVYSVRVSAASDQGLGGLKAYPNPCDLRSVPAGLTISGIPVDAVSPAVYIYNEAGELVRALSPGDGIDGVNTVHWDGKTKGGAKAASGLYLYLVRTTNYGKGSGKFFIVW